MQHHAGETLASAGAVAVLAITGERTAQRSEMHQPAHLRVQEIGRVHLWKVRMKPGMPLLVGEVGGSLLCCLPGNPVSGMATFLALVRPAIDAMLGRAARQLRRARLAIPVHKRHARAEYLRAQSRWDADGTLWVTPLRGQGSGMLHALAQADCLALIPEDVSGLDRGAVVEVLPLPGRD